MKLHELLDYIRPTQTITVTYDAWGDQHTMFSGVYKEITLMEAYDYMQEEVIGLEAIDGTLIVQLDDTNVNEGEEY